MALAEVKVQVCGRGAETLGKPGYDMMPERFKHGVSGRWFLKGFSERRTLYARAYSGIRSSRTI